MRYFATLLLSILISQIALGQDDYERFIQAILKGDTVLAEQIERNYADKNKIEPIKEYSFPVKNIPEHVFKFNINALKDTLVSFFKIENSPEENKFLKKIFYFHIDIITISVFFNAETSKDAIFSKEYFSKPNTATDIYLNALGEAWISKLYYSHGQPIK